MADPFDFSSADPNAPGFLGQSPGFWRDLAAFGGNLASAANARTSTGHLANGTGFAGPLGAATVQTLEMGQKNALARSLLQHQAAQTQGLNINNEIGRLGLPFQRALAGARMDALGQMGTPGGAGQATGPGASPASTGSGTLPTEYMPFYQEAAARTGIPIPVLVAQAKQESNFNPNAIGGAGEIGLHQILPSTARSPGFGMAGIDPASLSDPRTNINFAADYLKARGGPRVDFSNPATVDAALKNYNGGGDPNYVANVRRHMGGGMQAPAAPARFGAVAQPTATPQPAAAFAGNPGVQVAGPGAGPAPGFDENNQPLPAGWAGPRAQQAQAQPRQQAPAGQPQGPDIQQQARALQAEASHYEQLANRAALLGNGIGGDPTVLRQTAMEKRKLADQLLTSGPMEREKAGAAAGIKPETDRYGNMYTRNPDGSWNYLGRGSEVKPTIDEKTGREHLSDVGGIGIGAQRPVTDGEAPGTTLGPISKLSQAETERLKARGEVEGHDLTHDRKVIEEDLSHVVDTTIQAKTNLLKLRDLTDPAQTGFGANTLLGAKNFLQTWAPRLADTLDVNANPGQEFKKISTMGAGKAEREDQGARGGLRLMQIYMEANPNLENQPGANKHMANMLLLAHQLHEDYATGANDYYQRNREGFLDGKGAYKPISQYDQSFIQKMRPELYKAATDALNGKPYAEWSKGVTGPQLQIIGGVLQRADPNAQVDLGGRMVPVTAFTKTIGPTDLTNGR